MIRIVRIAAENESVRTGFESRLSDAQEAQGTATHGNGSTLRGANMMALDL